MRVENSRHMADRLSVSMDFLLPGAMAAGIFETTRTTQPNRGTRAMNRMKHSRFANIVRIRSGRALMTALFFAALALTGFACKNSDETNKPRADGERCTLTPEIGPCRAAMQRFYFDADADECRSFTWGGCQGVVPFETLEACKQSCE